MRTWEAMTDLPTELTPGQRRTLDGIAALHRRGLAYEGEPFYYLARGGRRRVCQQWETVGLVEHEWCGIEDAPDFGLKRDSEYLCFRLTPKGIEWARGLGIDLDTEEP